MTGRRLKRTLSKDANDAENADSLLIFPTAGFSRWLYKRKKEKKIALNLSSHGTPLVLRPVAMKSIKRPTRDVFQAFATHACLVHDVTDTEFRAQYDSTRRRCLATFKRECLNSSANVLCVFLCVPLLLIRPAMLLRFVSPLTANKELPRNGAFRS